MPTRILAAVLFAMLLAACGLSGVPPLARNVPTPTIEGEIAIPFTTIAVIIDYYADPTPTFITPPEVDANAESGSGPLWLQDYQIPRNPRLYMLAAPEDVEEVARYLPPKTVEAIHATDFTSDAVIVLLRGTKGGSGYNTFIERIGSRYGSLTAYAQFWVPVQGYAYSEVMTFPFHVVRIRRADLPTIGGSTPSLAIRYEAYEVTPTPPAVLPPN